MRLLLRTGDVAIVEFDSYEERTKIDVSLPEDVPEKLLEMFRSILAVLTDVDAA